MRFVVFLFLLILITPPNSVSAQVGGSIGDITGGNVSITLDPQYPNPGDRVTATIDDYALNGGGANITWFFDGLSAPTVANSRTINFIAPEVSIPMKILARLRFNDGKVLEATHTIQPLYLDLIVEPQTYAPIFYQGRALPTKGSLVYINALLQDKNGTVNSSDFTYFWTMNNKSVYGGARTGNSWAQVEVPHGQNNVITISIQNKTGVVVARKVVAIPTDKLDVQFYEVSSLFGLRQKAIINDLIMTSDGVSIKAIPYNLDLRAIGGDLFTQWTINDRATLTETFDPFEINLERGAQGKAVIGFKIRNLTELLQSDEGFFEVTS